jgi:hypothetical protein
LSVRGLVDHPRAPATQLLQDAVVRNDLAEHLTESQEITQAPLT